MMNPSTRRERVLLIGYGSIGASLCKILSEPSNHSVSIDGILLRNTSDSARQAALTHALLAQVSSSLDKLLSRNPTLIVECAAHTAVDQYAGDVLPAGLDFEATRVELVADPESPGNVHEIEASGAAGELSPRPINF